MLESLFIKKRLQHKCFSVNIAKFLRTPILKNTANGCFCELLLSFKGYLRYKTITSQNVPSKVEIKNFLFCRKVMFHSQDVQVFVFLTIP